MRIRMKKLSASPAGALQRGQVYDVADERGLRLVAQGAAVAVDEPARPRLRDRLRRKEEPADPPQDKPLEKQTVEQLKAYAEEHDISLPEGARKADILAAITAAEE